jgi:uracil-DNA glycosylase
MYEVLISHEAEKYYKKQDKDTKRRLNKCIDALGREPLFGQHIGLGLDKQLRQIWRTNSVLCSAVVEGGNVPNAIVRTCISSYLKPQLALVPNAMVAALGRKAQNRLASNGIAAYPALHPSSRVSNEEKFDSWKGLAKALKDHSKAIGHARGYVPPG